ncbi:teichoic acid biosynthesis protein C [Nonomuraea sp. NPDC004580]|uniref:phage baseplate protein n=1 Tax=Nonomuraea sp. NPDC004580 TaxID=3154552 RepID=UPI00339E416A
MPPVNVSRRSLFTIGAGTAAAAALASRPALAAEGRFQLTAPSTSLIWKKALYDETVLQSFAFDNRNGHIYTLQVKNGSGSNAAGDLCLTKLSLSGTILGHMYLMGFGHGVQCGVEPSGTSAYLWTETDGIPDGTSSRGTKLARFRFVDGRTLTPSSPELTKHEPIAGVRNVTCTIDPSTNRIVMRYNDNGTFRYAVYPLGQFTAGRYEPIFHVAQPGGLGTFQGYAVYGNFAYMLDGTAYSDSNPPPGNAHVTCFDLRTGEQVQRARTEAGRSLDFREPEGMGIQIAAGRPRLCLGLASGGSGARVASIFYKSELI